MLNIYKASAGSGKTYTLAKEYIKALLGVKLPGSDRYCLNSPKYISNYSETSNRHRYILAITFTNKATEEMKHRIIEKLDDLSQLPADPNKDADYASDLCKEFGCTRDELAVAAKKALRQLLNRYSDFNVTTIDSFFQRVLRTFARELDRQGDFSVELNDQFAVQVAVNAMLDDFNRNGKVDSPLGRWIVSYLSSQLDAGGKTNFFNRRSNLHTSLVKVLTNICEETFKPYEAAMKEYLGIDRPEGGNLGKVDALLKALHKLRSDILMEVKNNVESDLSLLAGNGVTLDQLNGQFALRRYIVDYFLTGKRCGPEIIDNNTLMMVADGKKDPFTKAFKGDNNDRELFSDMLRRVRARYYDFFAIEKIEKAVGNFALLAFAWRYLQNFSTDNNTVLLSDTGNMLNRIIGQDDTPFIYERMGVNLRNFLIDEFQDTSRMQWSNLMPLVRNGLGEGHDSLIIGDEKQSIYRFRNSDSSLLHTEVENVDFPASIYGTTVHGKDVSENTNWRSAVDIVLFNNTLFSNLTAALKVDGFDNVCQAIPEKHSDRRGYVEFVAITDKSVQEAFDQASDLTDVAYLSKEKKGMVYAVDRMAAKMMHQHDDLGYAWSDMVVLVNTNKEGASVIDRLMNAHPGIPVMSEEALYVNKSPAVQLVIGMLKLMNAPDPGNVPTDGFPTSTQLARILNRFEYFRNKGLTVDLALDEAMATANADDHISIGIDAVKKKKPSSIPALVETIIREQLSQEQRCSQQAYLMAFMDYVTDYCATYQPTLRAFLNNWETKKDRLSVSSDSGADAVRVMTIHKSKGLEFACVHIPFGSWDLFGKPRGQWISFPKIPGIGEDICPPAIYIELDKFFSMEGSMLYDEYCRDLKEHIEDTMNKTYVAYTRASEQLIVYYRPGKGIGENIADAMMAGYKGRDKFLTDISQFYDQGGGFVMGEDLSAKKEPADSAGMDVIKLEEYRTTDNDEAQVITRVADVLDFTPDDDENLDTESDAGADVYADEEARLRGIMLHDVLSRITTHADIPRAVNSYCATKGLTSEEKDDLMLTMHRILDRKDERVDRWFADNERAVNEQTIYDPANDMLKRIDRLVFLSDGSLEVIDYKFTSEMSRHHRRQVGGYLSLLRKMGYREVRGYLWYPLLDRVIEVNQRR